MLTVSVVPDANTWLMFVTASTVPVQNVFPVVMVMVAVRVPSDNVMTGGVAQAEFAGVVPPDCAAIAVNC